MATKRFQPRGKHGGKRQGAGRKKGGRNRTSTKRTLEMLTQAKQLPLDYMVAVYTDPNAKAERRDVMARAAAPYFHPRLSSIEVASAQTKARHSIDIRKLTDDELLAFEQIVAKAGVLKSDEVVEEPASKPAIGYMPMAAKTGKLED